MSRIILSFTRKWPSLAPRADPCVLRCRGQRGFQSRLHHQTAPFLIRRSAAPSKTLLIRLSISHSTYSTSATSVVRWKRPYLQVSNTRARSQVGPAPASLSTTFARACLVCQAWPALDLTTKPLPLRLPPTTSTLVQHLDSPSPPTFSSTLELDPLPVPSITTVAALQGFVSLFCTS